MEAGGVVYRRLVNGGGDLVVPGIGLRVERGLAVPRTAGQRADMQHSDDRTRNTKQQWNDSVVVHQRRVYQTPAGWWRCGVGRGTGAADEERQAAGPLRRPDSG